MHLPRRGLPARLRTEVHTVGVPSLQAGKGQLAPTRRLLRQEARVRPRPNLPRRSLALSPRGMRQRGTVGARIRGCRFAGLHRQSQRPAGLVASPGFGDEPVSGHPAHAIGLAPDGS
jgi:hypothetical protein